MVVVVVVVVVVGAEAVVVGATIGKGGETGDSETIQTNEANKKKRIGDEA